MKKSLFLLTLVFLMGSLVAQNWQTIQSDDFNRPDGPIGESYDVYTYPENSFIEIVNNNVILGPADSDLYAAIKTPMSETGIPFKISLDFKARSATNEAYCGYGVMAVSENNSSIGAVAYLDEDAIEIVYMDQNNQMTTLFSTDVDINDTLWYTVELIVNTDQLSMNLLDADGVELYTLGGSYQDTLSFNKISINTYQSTGEIIHFDDLMLQNQGTDIAENSLNPNVHIYPNPSSDVIKVEGISSRTKVDIYAITGRKITESIIESSSQEIDIKELHKGIYMLKLTSEQGVYCMRLIKS